HTQDESATLREIVESERLLSPLNTSLDYAYTYHKPSRSETYVSASVKEIDYVQLGIVIQVELKLQPRPFLVSVPLHTLKALELKPTNLVASPPINEPSCVERGLGLERLFEEFEKENIEEEVKEEIEEKEEERELGVDYFDKFLTKDELSYHKSDNDKRRGVDYVMFGFYMECLELGSEYKSNKDDMGSSVTNDGVT
nr:hypothetical protein [Tanacetum cinerariifolium]